jgi:hypothetical protein
MQRLRQRLSFANVMSVLAVFIALGGSGCYAALSKNSVGSKKNVAEASLQDSCPAGMSRFGNTVCIDTAPRATGTLGTAIITCAQANLRLPSVTEAYMVFNAGLMQSEEWTWVDTIYRSATGFGPADSAVQFHAAGGYVGGGLGFSNTVRCATVPGSG